MFKRLLVLLVFTCLSIAEVNAQNPMHIKIDSINSSYDEFNPVLSPDGNTLYVTKRGHAQNIAGVIDLGDIWYATKTANGWSKLKHGGEVINHQGLNGVVGFSTDGNRMYLLNYFDTDGNGGGTLRNGIAMSTRSSSGWSKPERLKIKYFQNNSSHLSATISRDEKVLIMAMESYTTEGNEDLYVSFKQENDEWTQPESLGLDINTFGQEWSPFLASDNQTLYFSTNARGGEGSRDIFLSVRNEGSWNQWSEPMNLGPEINTEGVEFGFYIPKNTNEAFFSSTQNSEGRGDIFKFALAQDRQEPEPQLQDTVVTITEPEPVEEKEVVAPIIVAKETTEPQLQPTKPEEQKPSPSMVVMTFQVLDADTEKPVDAKVVLTNGGDDIIFQTSELEGDKKFMKAFVEGDSVFVEIKSAGYLDYKEAFVAMATPSNLDGEFGSNVEAFYLTRKEVGTSVIIENVFFKRGSASFINETVAHQQIDELVTMMNENRDVHIRLEGHTDNMGDASILKSLSEARVKTVKRYLVSQGIAEERIEVMGYGGSRPITSNETQAGREMNRRVEFVIIR